MCAPLAAVLRRLFGSCRQGAGRSGKRPENFLTPYEMEMVPLMLKELDDLDHRFYQMVCYRWFKDVAPHVTGDEMSECSSGCVPARSASSCNNAAVSVHVGGSTGSYALSVGTGGNCSASTTTISTTSSSTTKLNRSFTPTFEDFVNEGQALRHMIRVLSRTLRDTGTFDNNCEAALAAYRTRRQQWQVVTTSENTVGVASRVRSYSALPNVSGVMTMNGACRTSNCAFFANSNASNSFSFAGTTPILMLNNEPNADEEQHALVRTIQSNGIQRRRPATTIVDSRGTPTPYPLLSPFSSDDKTTIPRKKISKKTVRKQRQRAAESCDALFVQLGDILRHQFHTTVIVNDHKATIGVNVSTPPTQQQKSSKSVQQQLNENVHERELKVLIWRHFVQMLVAVLTDRDRFPV